MLALRDCAGVVSFGLYRLGGLCVFVSFCTGFFAILGRMAHAALPRGAHAAAHAHASQMT